MRVLVLPADVTGCGSYRLIWAAQHLQQQGYDVDIQWPNTESGLEVHIKDDEVIDVIVPGGADVVVLQRVAHDLHSRAVAVMRRKGVAVVIDMDDDLTCIHRQNVGYASYHPRSNTPYSWKNAELACRTATYVTLSTKTLLNVYAKHGRGYVIDNYVPERYLDIEVEKVDAFGWAGTTLSHPADLQVCGRAVQDLINDGLNFRVVGPPSNVKAALKLSQPPENTGIVPMEFWARENARLQVAIAPLEMSPFNSSKSRLKLAEASAVGVPWVASPRTEYRRFHQESGGGLLAEKPKDWYKEVKRLMEDESLRKDLSERGREFMRTQTIEINSWRWLEAWETALRIQRGDNRR